VFDQLGNLTSFTDRRGKVSNYQYDGINRRTFAGYGFVSPNYESTVNYYYDGGNRLNKVVDSTSGTITPVFDGLDRLVTETTPQGVVNYTYDNDSRLQTATVTGQPTVSYYFDNASRLYKSRPGQHNYAHRLRQCQPAQLVDAAQRNPADLRLRQRLSRYGHELRIGHHHSGGQPYLPIRCCRPPYSDGWKSGRYGLPTGDDTCSLRRG
jgi:YD repeat-containing protein